MVLVVDTSGTILFVNRIVPFFEKQGAVGRKIWDFVPDRGSERLGDRLREVVETRKAIYYEADGYRAGAVCADDATRLLVDAASVAEQLGQDRRKAGGYLTSAVTLSVLSGTVFGLAVFVLSPQLATDVLGKRSLTTAMAMAAPLLLFSPLADILIGAITGLQRFRTLGWLQGARGALDGVLLILGALTGGIVGGIAGYVAAEAVSCVIAGLAVHRAARAEAIELHPGLDRTILPSLVRFLLPSLSTSLLLAVSLSLGQIFLAHQPGGLASVGVFAFAQRFYLAALFLPQVIGVVLFPLLSSLSATGQFHRFRRLLRGYLAVICFTATLGAGALFLLAGFLAALRGHGGGAEVHTLGILALVAIPTAMPDEPLISRFGIRAGRTVGSSSLPS